MKKLKGIIPPLVTPLLDEGRIDYSGAERIVDRMITAGVSGVFLLGTTGESQSIAMHLRFEYVERMCSYVSSRVPVLVGVTDTSMEDSLALAAHAKRCGATAVVSAPPYYFPANQDELKMWYQEFADRSPLPVYLYNMPSKVKVRFAVPTVKALSAHPNIIGLKDSSGDLDFVKEVISLFKGTDFGIYMGPEEQTSEVVRLGCDGGVNGGANLFPELFVKSYKAASSGDTASADYYQNRIMYLSEQLYGLNRASDASFLCGLKTALGVLGLCSPYVALPYRQYDSEKLERVKAVIADLLSKDYK